MEPPRARRPAVAAVEAFAEADGRSGVPAGLDRAGTTRGNAATKERSGRVTCRRGSYRSAAFVRATAPHTPPPAGSLISGPSDSEGASRRRAGLRGSGRRRARRVPLGSALL